MAKFGKIFFVFAVVGTIAAVAFCKISKGKINFNDIQDCPSLLMQGTPTIASYGSDFVILQSMHQQRLRSGQSYSFEQIIYGAPYKVKVLLLDTGNQGDFLVTEEDLFTYTSESDQERKHVKYACKQPVGGQTYSPLNDISSLFVNFDSSKWEILNAIEMISNHESFKSNANYHYVVYINGKFKDTLKEKSAFDAAVDILNFESHAAAQEYYKVQSEILRRNAIGNEDVSVVLPTSGSQSYCFDNSLNEPDKGCIFIGYLGDRVVEIKLFPHSAIADIEAIKEYWPEFVMNLWEGVFDNYSG